MKVLTAASGTNDGDFANAIPGEIVFPGVVCTWGIAGGCGCEVSFTGLTSNGDTSVAVVTDVEHLGFEAYVEMAEAWTGEGSGGGAWPTGMVRGVAARLCELSASLAVGAIVRRHIDEFIEVEA